MHVTTQMATPAGDQLTKLLAASDAARALGDYATGVVLAEQAATAAETAGDQRQLARALQLQAGQLSRLGQPESAVKAGERALSITRSLHDDARSCDLLVSQALSLASLGLNIEAMEALAEGRQLAIALRDSTLLFWVVNRTGVVQSAMGENESAFLTMQRALPLAEGLDAEAQFCIHTNMADNALWLVPERRRADNADGAAQALANGLEHGELALELARDSSNPYREALALSNLGMLLGLAGRDTESLLRLEASRVLCLEYGYRTLELAVKQHVGEVALLRGDPESAALLLAEALDLGVELGEQHMQLQILGSLCDAHEQAGQLREALARMRQLHRLESELRSAVAATRLRLLEHQEQLERAHLEADMARNESAWHRARSLQLEADKRSLQRRAAELDRSAHLDALTGLGNRRQLERDLPGLINKALADKRRLCFAMVDIDHFKRVNDRFGHAVGDQVLIRVAQKLLLASRPGDAVLRIGGEEFLIAFQDADLAETRLACERLRAEIHQLDLSDLNPGVHVTVSIGISPLCDATTVTELIDRADSELYRAKAAGRNRISCGKPEATVSTPALVTQA